MGYRCPACDTPQADGEHLANHLAFTAMTRGGEHATWLDEHAPGWGDDSPGELATRIVEHAAETDHEPSSRSHDGSAPAGPEVGRSATAGTGSQFDGVVDAAVERVIDDARELTEEMFEAGDDSSGEAGEAPETKEE